MQANLDDAVAVAAQVCTVALLGAVAFSFGFGSGSECIHLRDACEAFFRAHQDVIS